MVERLEIQTQDGVMPVWRQGAGGRCGLIVFMDVYGVRDALHQLCADLAGEGYVTYLPELFYRAGDVAFPSDAPPPPEARQLNRETSLAMTAADIGALLAATAEPRAFAAVGFCMGTRHALATAAGHHQRVRACAMLHGGRLVTDDDASPHHLIPELRGPAYVGVAADDPTCPTEHQKIIAEALATSPPPHRFERFDARHGFMLPDLDVHDPIAAAQAKRSMLALFDVALRKERTE